MKLATNLRIRWKGFIDTIIRFPLTILLLAVAVITNAVMINSQKEEPYTKVMITLLIGASIYVVGQLLYERFFKSLVQRYIIMGVTIVLSAIYYIFIHNTNWGMEPTIRTTVIFFILLIAFLWIPVIRNKVNFNQSFMAAFKGFFITLFYSGILFLGITLIIRAITMLIIRLDENAFAHSANIIFMFLAPVYFLSLIPVYPNKGENRTEHREYIDSTKAMQEEANPKDTVIPDVIAGQEELLVKAVSPARILETLISYIIIPITAVFTIILLLYIIMNISGNFWTDNLMEPLLLSYSITVIIVYLLASNLKNVLADYFRKIFPKVLVPIVLFQTIASILKVGDAGITYGRYYVILFGVFAIVAGIIFCVLPVHKNGIIAPVLIALSLISIIPPVDAFTISKVNQTERLENALKRNAMLKENTIIPNADIQKKDQNIIINSVNYLNRMDYVKSITWLSDYHEEGDFKKTFGFTGFATEKDDYISSYTERDNSTPIPIEGYDFMIFRNVSNNSRDFETAVFKIKDKSYSIQLGNTTSEVAPIILTKGNKKIISFDTNKIFQKFTQGNKTKVNTKEVTFTTENESAVMTIVAQSVNVSRSEFEKNLYADIFIMVHIK